MNLLINFKNIITNLLPWFLRKTNTIQWLFSLIKPLERLHYDTSIVVTNFGQVNTAFYQWYEYIKNFLRYNGQIIYLEKYLNSVYYPTLADPVNNDWHSVGGIWIQDTASLNLTYVFNIAEIRPPVYLFNTAEGDTRYLFNASEPVNAYQFIVWVPVALVFDTVLMRSRINQYRIAGKRYNILTY